MPRETPPRSMIDVVAVTGGGDDGDKGVEVGAAGDDGTRGEWGRAEHSGRMKRDINSQRATLSGPCICGRDQGQGTEDAHALIAALLWDGVKLFLKWPCQGREAEDVDRNAMLCGSAVQVKADGMSNRLTPTLSRRPVQRG